jgi:membrane protease YdiL (CAAX protease family)
MTLEPDHRAPLIRPPERGSLLALLPISATILYYFLPSSLQRQAFMQCAPQLLAYGVMGLWGLHNSAVLSRLGLAGADIRDGFRYGVPTGILLGGLNTSVLLLVVPSFGYDLSFLKDTPHAQLPVWVMVPWFIGAIAIFVELNFRGFLLGRLAEMESLLWQTPVFRRLPPLALMTSVFAFAFDPFMVNTFRHLHWIALWDGLIWGIIRLRTGNLTITIIAHAVEVIVIYLAVRAALTTG